MATTFYSPLIQGLNGNIGYFIKEDLYKEICQFLNKTLSYNQVMAIVIGSALKQKDKNGNPYFDYEIESSLKNKIANYESRKFSLMNELGKIVEEGVNEYKSGSISFRF